MTMPSNYYTAPPGGLCNVLLVYNFCDIFKIIGEFNRTPIYLNTSTSLILNGIANKLREDNYLELFVNPW
jgi:hypothetical protein